MHVCADGGTRRGMGLQEIQELDNRSIWVWHIYQTFFCASPPLQAARCLGLLEAVLRTC